MHLLGNEVCWFFSKNIAYSEMFHCTPVVFVSKLQKCLFLVLLEKKTRGQKVPLAKTFERLSRK